MKYEDLKFEITNEYVLLWKNGPERVVNPDDRLLTNASEYGDGAILLVRCPLCGALIELGLFTTKAHLQDAHKWTRENLIAGDNTAGAEYAALVASALGDYIVKPPK